MKAASIKPNTVYRVLWPYAEKRTYVRTLDTITPEIKDGKIYGATDAILDFGRDPVKKDRLSVYPVIWSERVGDWVCDPDEFTGNGDYQMTGPGRYQIQLRNIQEEADPPDDAGETTVNDNLVIYTHDHNDEVDTVATFGADTSVKVSVCDGRPESQIDEITGNAVRLMIDSSCWDDDAGRATRISTTTALTAQEALRLARDLIAHASNIVEG